MRVTIVDRQALHDDWGQPGPTPHMRSYLRTVEIGDTCQVCGGPRGTPRNSYRCENDDWYSVSVWDNPCGHLDRYPAVLAEAQTRQARQGF